MEGRKSCQYLVLGTVLLRYGVAKPGEGRILVPRGFARGNRKNYVVDLFTGNTRLRMTSGIRSCQNGRGGAGSWVEGLDQGSNDVGSLSTGAFYIICWATDLMDIEDTQYIKRGERPATPRRHLMRPKTTKPF